MRKQLREPGKAIIPDPHLDIVQIRDTLYTFMLRCALGKNSAFPNANVPTDLDVRRQADEVFRSFFKFAAVRNPWARAVSLYHRREGVSDTDSRMSFDEFCERHVYASDTCRHPTLHRNQYDWLCDENGLLAMDYVYKVEEFDSAIDEIRTRSDGRVHLANARMNTNPRSQSGDYRKLYSERTRQLIGERFAKDIEAFGYSF